MRWPKVAVALATAILGALLTLSTPQRTGDERRRPESKLEKIGEPEFEGKVPSSVEKAFREALAFIEAERGLVSEEEYQRDREEMLEMLARARRTHGKGSR